MESDNGGEWVEEEFVACRGCKFRFAGGEVVQGRCSVCRAKLPPPAKKKRVAAAVRDTGPRVYSVGTY